MNRIPPKVSIIVPAYNAEKYLTRCLNSIAAQTMPDFECIIVNDGSTDQTGEIADEFARKDSRFRVIHQQNEGVAAARQKGIDSASGDYMIQFDADDWAEPSILEEMVGLAEKEDAGMVICDVYRVLTHGEIYESQKPLSLASEIVFGQMLQPQLEGGLWNKLFRRDSYQNKNIRFGQNMTAGEDQYFCLCVLSHPIKVAHIEKALYHYDLTQNPQSITHQGIPPAVKIKPLELIAESTNISNVQSFYDNAILFAAYEALFSTKVNCPNYIELFKKHLPSIRRAKGFPLRVKILVLLRIYGIRIPIYSIKKLFGKYKNG